MSGFGTPRLAEDGPYRFAISDVVPVPPCLQARPECQSLAGGLRTSI
jgi:hypothetical protein